MDAVKRVPRLTEMTDEGAARFRKRLIDLGIIRPELTYSYRPGERPPLSKELVEKLKAKLIKTGFLAPSRRD